MLLLIPGRIVPAGSDLIKAVEWISFTPLGSSIYSSRQRVARISSYFWASNPLSVTVLFFLDPRILRTALVLDHWKRHDLLALWLLVRTPIRRITPEKRLRRVCDVTESESWSSGLSVGGYPSLFTFHSAGITVVPLCSKGPPATIRYFEGG